MEAEQSDNERIVETILVVDIDPSLTLFKPTCTFLSMPVRVEMGLKSRTHLLTSQGTQIKFKDHPSRTRPSTSDWLLLKK